MFRSDKRKEGVRDAENKLTLQAQGFMHHRKYALHFINAQIVKEEHGDTQVELSVRCKFHDVAGVILNAELILLFLQPGCIDHVGR